MKMIYMYLSVDFKKQKQTQNLFKMNICKEFGVKYCIYHHKTSDGTMYVGNVCG